MPKRLILAMLLGLMFLPAAAWAEVRTVVSILPQKYFVEKVGGELVNVEVMVPAGASPHSYEPKPSQMAALARAQVYFAIGVEFEKAWLPRLMAANPGIKLVHTEAKAHRQPMEAEKHAEEGGHGHEAEHEHAKAGEHGHEEHQHEGLDPHIWTAPRLVKLQAQAIRDALIELDPEHQTEYEANYATFALELDALDAELKAAFAGLGGQNRFLVYHPSWGYLARAYGLVMVPIEQEGKQPGPRGLARLIDQAKKLGVKVVFVQPQFSAKDAQVVAQAIGGKVIALNPLAEDWVGNLKLVAREVKGALR